MRRGRSAIAELTHREFDDALPAGWHLVRLGDVAAFQPGYAFKSSWFQNRGLRLLRGTNIEPGGTRWDDTVCLDVNRASEFEEYKLNAGDLVLAMDRPVISTGLKLARLGETDMPALLLQRVGRFVPSVAIDTGFLHLFLRTAVFLEHIGALATGTQLPHISKTDIESAPLPLPKLDVQRRIVAKLDALLAQSRAAREQLEAVPALVEQYRQSVLAAAFRGDLTADWRKKNPNVEPASKLLERIRIERRKKWEEGELAKMKAKGKAPKDDKWKTKYEEPEPVDAGGLPELPPTWCWASLDELLSSMRNGISAKPAESNGQPILRISAVRPMRIDLEDVRFLPPSDSHEAYALRDGDLLFTRYNGNADLVGACGVVRRPSRPLVYPDKLIRCRTFAELVPEFIAMAASAGSTRAFIAKKSKSAAGQIGISGADLKSAPFPLAPIEEQRVLALAETLARDQVVGALSGSGHASEALDDLDRALLAKAFNGELAI